MRKTLLLAVLAIRFICASAHDLHQGTAAVREWHLHGDHHRHLKGSFFLMRDDTVYLENLKGQILHLPLNELSAADQQFAREKQQQVEQINRSSRAAAPQVASPANRIEPNGPISSGSLLLFALSGLLVLLLVIRLFSGRLRYSIQLLGLSVIAGLTGFTRQQQHTAHTTTDPLFLDSAFAYFHPEVNTFWDTTYFHVESKGIPLTHEMMTGITKWQQQVPIPQCYIGNNSWSIPLNPVLAPTPVPVSPQHFIRGAIAVAVNGVPIFNPYTNTGVDAFLDGQLDNYGGHSGRADDYHYHTAPLHLYGTVPTSLPVAFALDGYAVYGALEPNGSPMATLDTNNGHFGSNGVYHYHGVAAAPYMIGYMVGRVTEDTTLQIIPQARAYPVRPSLTPLTGAAITDHRPNGSGNGYTLEYTLAGQTDSIEYHWSQTGQYQYNFYTSGNGIPVTQNYNGFSQCSVPTAISAPSSFQFNIYPNPTRDRFMIVPPTGMTNEQVSETVVYSITGEKIVEFDYCPSSIATSTWSAGTYYIVFGTDTGRTVKKIIVR